MGRYSHLDVVPSDCRMARLAFRLLKNLSYFPFVSKDFVTTDVFFLQGS